MVSSSAGTTQQKKELQIYFLRRDRFTFTASFYDIHVNRIHLIERRSISSKATHLLLMFSIFEIGSRNQYVSIKHRVCICTPLIYLYPSHLSYSINWYAASIYPYTMKIRVRLIVEIYYPFNVRLICKKVFQRLKKKHNKVSVVGTSFIMVEIACNWLKLK